MDGALDDALEAGRRLGVGHRLVDGEAAELFVEEGLEGVAQLVDIDVAGAQHRHRVLILGERQQEMLEGGQLMLATVGMGEGPVQCLFESFRQHLRSFPTA